MIAHRKKLTSREIIQTHRSRFGGCGVFSRPTPNLSEMAVGERSHKKPTTSELIDGATSPEHRDAMLDDSENDDESLKVEPLRRSN